MPIIELYSARKRALERSGQTDVYQYDQIPPHLRVQIQQIFSDAIGPYDEYDAYGVRASENNDMWRFIHKTLCRERGVHSLIRGRHNPYEELMGFVESAADSDEILDFVELGARCIDKVYSQLSEYDRRTKGITQEPEAALNELNHRFRMAGVGYQYEAGLIVRVDSQFLHEEVVKPALSLLMLPGFSGPQAEFTEAHRHYRTGDFKDAVTWAGKAFESTMKAICDRKGWAYDGGARASDLIKVLRRNKLWPDYLDPSFDQLLATLGSGLPQVRNQDGAHGDGAVQKKTPGYVAAYAIHLAASKAVLMIKAAELE